MINGRLSRNALQLLVITLWVITFASCSFILDIGSRSVSSSSESLVGSPSEPLPPPASDSVPPVEFQTISAEQALAKMVNLQWTLESANDSAVIVYRIGTDPPPNCEPSTDNIERVILDGQNHLTLSNLTPDTQYSARICRVEDSGAMSGGTTIQWRTLRWLNLTPAYSAFPDWNDYLAADGTTALTATGTQCDPNLTNEYSQCLHGAELRVAELPGIATCNGLEIEEELNSFRWQCIEGSPIKIMSVHLKPDKGLHDLLIPSGFKSNSVVVKIAGTPTFSSDSGVWWNNPVLPLPGAVAGTTTTLSSSPSGPGRIYVFSENQTGGSYAINSDKIAVVGLNDAKLALGPGPVGPILTISALVSTSPINFLWIEGHYNGSNLASGVYVRWAQQLRLHHIRVSDLVNFGLRFSATKNALVTHFEIIKFSEGISINTNLGLTFIHGKIGESLSGLNKGISSNNGTSPRFSDILFYNISDNGIYPLSPGTVGGRLTFVNMTGRALRIPNISVLPSFLRQLLIINNSDGFYTFNSSKVTLSQAAIGASDLIGYDIQSVSPYGPSALLNQILLTPTPICSTSDATLSGFTNGTCLPAGSSSATIQKVLDPNKVFRGKLTEDDPANTSDLSGSQIFDQILDWLNFGQWYRTWSRSITSYPSTTGQGPCLSGTCEIRDYRLNPSTDNATYNNSAFDPLKNTVFAANAPCPLAVHGNEVTTTDIFHTDLEQVVSQTFLTHAEEFYGDHIGDDDFLCESNEECLYMPNFGAYQGEGDPYQAGWCQFQNGILSNIKIFAHPNN